MASNADFVQYVADQCSGAGEITTRKMFGDYGIYCNGLIFGLICDNRLFIKPTAAARSIVPDVCLLPPYDGARPYLYMADVDDRDFLSHLVRATCEELSQLKKKK
ncbi:MAG: TfoX/Sxy family protein [Bacteroidaceae bacterium]|nr:TfoX/Sxy family protein [Bacteroidaceae bacterium]